MEKRKYKPKYDINELRKLVESGMSNDDIAKKMYVSSSTVAKWIKESDLTGIRRHGGMQKEKPKEKKKEKLVVPGHNADHHLCRTCRWRMTGSAKQNGGRCDYASHHERTRSYYCSVEDCWVYEKGNPKKNKKTISI